MNSRSSWPALVVTLLAACSTPEAQSQAPAESSTFQLRLRIRDSETGLPVARARVSTPGQQASDELDAAGRGTVVGRGSLEVSAPGYAPLRAKLDARVATGVHTIWLDPLDSSPRLSPAAVAASRRPEMALLHGHVFDETGLPLEGASVEAGRRGVSTRTDASGYFSLQLPGTAAVTPDDLPPMEELLVRATGFSVHRLKDVALFQADLHFIVDLKRGSGEVAQDYGHKLVKPPETFQDPAPDEDDSLGVSTFALNSTALHVIDPPDSITVDDVGTMSLESYVGNGIVNEWIASWRADALKAGAVAYRSYGAAYQIASGRICATASCQVYKATGSSVGKAAAAATAGIVLTSNGTSIARSEYSAENNSEKCTTYSCSNSDLSCGAGKAGSPAAGWPCLDDAHAFTSGPKTCCFGHGRGMCQWGTSAWAIAGRNWAWMVNHYYNDEGNGTGKRTFTMTSPIEITAVRPAPARAAPGATVTLEADLRSYAEGDHTAILLRGSLARGAAPIPNPSGATALTVKGTTGQGSQTSTASQPFVLAAGTAAGAYDVIVELFLDVDGDESVGAADVLLASRTLAGALTVDATPGPDAGLPSSPDAGPGSDAAAARDASTILDAGPGQDAGALRDSGMATDAAASPDSGAPSDEPIVVEGSCGCSASGTSAPWWVLLGVLGRARRRRGGAVAGQQ